MNAVGLTDFPDSFLIWQTPLTALSCHLPCYPPPCPCRSGKPGDLLQWHCVVRYCFPSRSLLYSTLFPPSTLFHTHLEMKWVSSVGYHLWGSVLNPPPTKRAQRDTLYLIHSPNCYWIISRSFSWICVYVIVFWLDLKPDMLVTNYDCDSFNGFLVK